MKLCFGFDLFGLAIRSQNGIPIGVFFSELAREADIELEFLVKILDDLVR